MATLVWLQRELRLSHLPALQLALQQAKQCSDTVIWAYFHDPKQTVGQANSLWLAHSLQLLQQRVSEQGGALWIIEGEFKTQFQALIQEYAVNKVNYSFQLGTPFQQLQQQALSVCQQLAVQLEPFYSETLMLPEQVQNQQNRPYVVFTPFYKKLLTQLPSLEPIESSPGDLSLLHKAPYNKNWLSLPDSLNRLLSEPWAKKVIQHWQVGEQAAWQRLDDFVESDIDDYDEDRNYPALRASSRLSPHLHFGELNGRAIYFYLQARLESGEVSAKAVMPWLRQLIWGEFAKTLLWFYPESESQPFQAKFERFEWEHDPQKIDLWQRGQTGIPIIDAGMRELWQTGSMHNRVRMLVASFLTKNLNQSWLVGKQWFDQTLLDADPANNSMGWQWVAGCGVDAAPYYRLFNPVLQSQKFDAKGEYLREWLPELKSLSDKAIHAPWQYQQECADKGITLGEDYPKPMVDLKQSRASHLQRVEALASLKFAID